MLVARSNPPMIAGEGLDRIDLVVHCQGLESFESEYANALDLAVCDFAIKMLPLERVIVSKQAAGRRKDLAVLEVLRAALVASRGR